MPKPKILLVDDEEDIRTTLGRRIAAGGYALESAADGSEALKKAESSRPDLILMDVMMPGMDGYEVCARLQSGKLTAAIPVLFLTALGHEQDQAKAFSLGAVDYLVKPVDERTLLDKIGACLKTAQRWHRIEGGLLRSGDLGFHYDFEGFKRFLEGQLGLDEGPGLPLEQWTSETLYT